MGEQVGATASSGFPCKLSEEPDGLRDWNTELHEVYTKLHGVCVTVASLCFFEMRIVERLDR